MTKKTLSIILMLCLSIATLTACQDSGSNVTGPALEEPVGVDVDVAKVKKMDLSGVISFEGQVVPVMRDMYFSNNGVIKKVYVSTGDKVKKGQLLATLISSSSDTKELRKQLKEKRSEAKDANEMTACDIARMKTELKQLKMQYKKAKNKNEKAGLKAQIKEKKQDVKIEKLRFRQQKQMQNFEIGNIQKDISDANSNKKQSKLYSTVKGEVISVVAGAGRGVEGGETAVIVADVNSLRVQTDFVGDKKVSSASSYVATVNGKKYSVKKETQKISTYDNEMMQLPTSSYFDFVEKTSAKIGDSATIDLYSDTADEALVIPANALFGKKGNYYVYVMKGDVKNKVAVTIGTQTDAYVQIMSGVEEGDEVYVQG